MAKAKAKQEEQAAAEERDEILEIENQTDGPNMAAVPTPEDTSVAGGTHIERGEVDGEAEVDDQDAGEASDDTAPAAKAGKRSAKAQREAEAEATRKQTAEHASAETETPKVKRVVQARNPLRQHGKNYRQAIELVDRTKAYPLDEAVELAKKTAKTKFDATIELHVNLGVDPRQADQMVRATVTLPAGTGKKLRVAVLAPTDQHAAAKKAGADIVSDGDLLAKIEKGQLDFDVLVATPAVMPQLGKVAKVLGPRGLMPSPKSGTVTANVASAVEQAKAGRVEFRIDKQAIVHLAVGKASFSAEQLNSNITTAIQAILRAKPSAAKGTYVQAISLASSMGPGIKLDVQQAIAVSNPKR